MSIREKADLVDCALRSERDRLRKIGGGYNVGVSNTLSRAVQDLDEASKARLHDIIRNYPSADEAYQAILEGEV